MCVDIRKEVIRILESYPSAKRKIALLRYELEHPQQITSDELVGALNFAHGDGSMPSVPGHISNKTMYIAMSYQEKAAAVNSEVLDSIATKLFVLEREVNRLEYFVSLMDEADQETITEHYMHQRTSEDIAEKSGLSRRTVFKQRNKAIDNLVEMYLYSGAISDVE
ncbi:MAG: hypothetical protein SNI70_07170 [Rikenellaceae bacterium]